jgi:TolB-like protein
MGTLNVTSFFTELKRRNVFRVGIAYLIVAWLIIQVTDVMIDNIGAPDWLFQGILLVLGIGFPIALFFAWAFEVTPDGVKRDADVDHSSSTAGNNSRKLDRGIIVVLVIALAYFIWQSRYEMGPDTLSETTSVSQDSMSDQKAYPAPISESVEKSVAVLPFQNMSSDPEQEYFSDGITEEIINALVKIPGLSVPARTSVFAFKGENRDVRDIGQELGVAHILEGSVRSQGDQVRITAQLIKVDDGFHLWSETFDRSLQNIFVVQEEIAASISEVLVGELGLASNVIPNRTGNMEAYDLYLQGRAHLRKRGESLRHAIEFFDRVNLLDPDFVPAWAARAIAYQVSANDLEGNLQSIEVSRRALALDPGNVDTLTALAAGLRDTWQWLESEQYFDKALAIDPQSSELLEDYAEFLVSVGRTEELLIIAERGFNIDPNLNPLFWGYIEALTINGQARKAVQLVEIHDFPQFSGGEAFYFQAPVLMLEPALVLDDTELASEQIRKLGRQLDSEQFIATAIKLLNNPSDSDLRAELRPYLDSNYTPDNRMDDFVASLLLIYVDDIEAIIDVELSELRNDPSDTLEFLWSPLYDQIRQHPRWQEYLEITGLIEYWNSTQWPEQCHRANSERIVCQ